MILEVIVSMLIGLILGYQLAKFIYYGEIQVLMWIIENPWRR
jgi:uncharacterized protein YneF (UPF0154 family)